MEGNKGNGVYRVYPYINNTTLGLRVYCDLETKGGGWTVILRREEIGGPMIRFNRGWTDYVTGFGFLNYTHWLGLEHMAALTSGLDQELLAEMTDWEDTSLASAYKLFYVGSNRTDYHLVTGPYYNDSTVSGEIFPPYKSPSFLQSTYVGFSTVDREFRDVTRGIRSTCATQRQSAWWFNDKCYGPNLNGVYIAEGGNASETITWKLNGKAHRLKFVEIKIRNRNYPKGCVKQSLKPRSRKKPDSDADAE